MRNVWLIARREYLERVRAKSFIVMTILIPMLMGAMLFGASLINGRDKAVPRIAVVTQDSRFGLDMQTELSSRRKERMSVDVISPPATETRDLLNTELKEKELDGYLWVTPGSAGTSQTNLEWVPASRSEIGTRGTLGDAVRAVLTKERLTNSGLGASEGGAATQAITVNKTQALKNDHTSAAVTSAYGMFFIMYFVILFYGMNVARSIIEEKTSRIFEVLLATIRPEEMMAGKVIGVGAVGLTQVGVWLILSFVLTAFGAPGARTSFDLSLPQIIFFVVFFLLGYLLYSGVAAALGAMTSSEQELQQMNIFLMLPLIASSVVIFRVVSDPDGRIAKAFSMFPFCAPLIMYVRIAVHQPPWYQIAIAIAGMVVTIYAVLWLSSRIYRVGILMYGKKPNLSEIARWLRYS